MSEIKKFGLLGEKLGHSYSKVIHESLFKEIDFNGEYLMFEKQPQEINDLVEQIKNGDISGINVTIPYKETILKYLDILSDEVKEIGSCNTVIFKNGKTIGYNTDYDGFAKSLERKKIDVSHKKATILGAGGATKAIVAYLLSKLCEVTVVSLKNDQPNLKLLKNRYPQINIAYYEEIDSIKGEILIQATPVGMYPNCDQCIVSESIIKKYKIAIDLIYNPEITLFLKRAKDLGLVCLNGLDMLLDQAIKSEMIWNDIMVDEDLRMKLYYQLRGKMQ